MYITLETAYLIGLTCERCQPAPYVVPEIDAHGKVFQGAHVFYALTRVGLDAVRERYPNGFPVIMR